MLVERRSLGTDFALASTRNVGVGKDREELFMVRLSRLRTGIVLGVVVTGAARNHAQPT
jgi:hypothetical protein